jgi:hypothetical protein
LNEGKKKKESANETKTSEILLIGVSTQFGNHLQFVIEPKHLVD